MPHFVASSGSISGLTYNWKLQVIFHDRHGNPHRDFDTGDPNDTNSSSSVAPQDTVTIPANGSWHQVTDGSPWNIYEDSDWTAAVTGSNGFFGGDAVLSLKIQDSSGNTVVPEQDYNFRIAGENPTAQSAQGYIASLYGGPQAPSRDPSNPNAWQGYWFADAMAREETNGEGGQPFYNQFLANGGSLTNKYVPWPGHEGRPNWNNDKTTHDRPTGTGGYGLFQHTYESGDKYYPIIPRDWIWNWQSNASNYSYKLAFKLTAAQKTYNGLVATFGAKYGTLPNRLSFSGLESLVLTYNNGGGGGTRVISLGSYGKRLTCWSPGPGIWRFLPNGENYVDKVNANISH
jgi:hypothetical protein